ncbi:MAG TPA: branched-chain amino acid ABC transporter permease [Thermomicrobiales bacterium]|nr:branched-chain amino acid ABC transporter permease [Thermomicrobiales bacterium]
MARVAADSLTDPGALTGRLRAGRVQQLIGPWALWLLIIAFAAWAAFAHTPQFVVGLIVGSLYGLSAVGLTLIYGVARVSHFAHGDAMMMAAYLAFFVLTGAVVGSRTGDVVLPLHVGALPGAMDPIWRFSFGYGLVIAIIVGAMVVVPLLLVIDRVVYQPLHRRGAGTAILAVASLGVAISLRGIMLFTWGADNRRYSGGIRETVNLPGLPAIVADQFFIVLAALLLAVITYFQLYHTRLGTAMRATADNSALARASGIDVAATRRWTWIIGGALTAVAGCLLALQSQLSPDLGFVLLLPIFAAAILGGVGSPHGAFIGGLIVGVVGEVAVGVGIISPGYKLAVVFVVLVAVILLRPQGLFGARE